MHPRQLQADKAACDGGLCIGQGQLCVVHHVQLDIGHTGQGPQARLQLQGRALDADEHIGHAVVTVEVVTRIFQRLVH